MRPQEDLIIYKGEIIPRANRPPPRVQQASQRKAWLEDKSVNNDNVNIENDEKLNVNNVFVPKVSIVKGLKCLYTNTDVLYNKMDELTMYVDSECIDIIAITETLSKHRNDDYTPVFVINGFNCLQNNESIENCT